MFFMRGSAKGHAFLLMGSFEKYKSVGLSSMDERSTLVFLENADDVPPGDHDGEQEDGTDDQFNQ